tara:strand:- start:1917 stop:2138 length:222 start_codon:yes stop_codon:yes gene_type:complete
MEFCYSGGYCNQFIGDIMKEYVLKIGFDPITEKVLYVEEYIDKSRATLRIDDEDIELEDEISDYIVGDVMGIS